MAENPTVLLLGGTGRTGRKTLQQLLERGVYVRAIVRSASGLPPGTMGHPNLSIIQGSVLAMSDDELRGHLDGCEVVVSCLGHVLSLRGVFGPPWGLVTQAVSRICRLAEQLQSSTAVKLVLMSSVSVHRPLPFDAPRGWFERLFMALLRAVLPPALDNQRAADWLLRRVGVSNKYVQWVVVRPDTLLEGEITEYSLHPDIRSSLFKPDSTNMANVAHFMCELATDPVAWSQWHGRLPVIVNTPKAE